MQLPSMLQGESLTRLLQGTAIGAVAAMAIGFNWGGWMLESTAAKQTEDAAKSAVISVLAPICADKFQQAADVSDNMAMLKKESSYQQASFVDKGGWAILPGSETAGSGVAKACAAILVDLK
jgi:hypothetical protein